MVSPRCQSVGVPAPSLWVREEVNMDTNHSNRGRLGLVGLVTAVVGVMAFAGAAGASAPDDASDVIVPQVTALQGQLLPIAVAVVGASVIFLAIRKGWRMLRGVG